MSTTKQSKYTELAREGIRQANKGNIFISKSDAFTFWNLVQTHNRKQVRISK